MVKRFTQITLGALCLLGTARASTNPNIIFIYADDMGYGDVQCLNPDRGKIPTPQMDKLAADGMVFTDAHTTSSVCTPSRYALLTGRYNWRTHLQNGVLWGYSEPLIAPDRLTVPGLLKEHGYETACIGKWHLGMTMPTTNGILPTGRRPKRLNIVWDGVIEDGPIDRGFDHFHGISASLDMSPYIYIENDRFDGNMPPENKSVTAVGFDRSDVLPWIGRKTAEYIRSREGEKPFFVYVPLTSPHTPILPTEEWTGKSGLNKYADFQMQTDHVIGQIIEAVDSGGFKENTVVIVSSDNGCSRAAGITELEEKGHYPSAQYRGSKADIWEGGHRVPFIVRWPAAVKAGSTSDALICMTDLLATCADLVGAELPATVAEDSVSFLPALKGDPIKTERAGIVHHSISGHFAYRQDNWKLILAKGSGGWTSPTEAKLGADAAPAQLYDLTADPGENTNLYESQPEVATRLLAQLEQDVVRGRSTPGPDQKNDTEEIQLWKNGAPEGAGLQPSAKKAVKRQETDKPHAVIVVGTHHYSPQKTMPPFAAELERLGFRTAVINPDWDPEKDERGLPGLEALAQADVALFFTRFLKLDEKQLSHITEYLESGKPVVGFRTSTHGFNYPKGHPRQELNASFGRDALGTPYLIHLAGKTQINLAKGAERHPILTGVDLETWESPGTLYLTMTEPGIVPLLVGTGNAKRTGKVTNQFGTHELQKTMTDTVAWTWTNKWGGRTFTTSLGHEGDFAVPQSMRVMVNGVFWAAGLELPASDTEVKPFTPGRTRTPNRKAKPAAPPKQEPAPRTDKDSTILFYGNSMIERLLEQGELEARLQIAQPDAGLMVRSLAWTGDEVGNRLRLEGYAKHMKNLLAEWPADTIVLGYGLNESFAGEAGLAEFQQHYADHLDQLSRLHPGARFVLLSPIAIEGASEARQAEVELYSKAIADLAADADAAFVDLFSLTRKAYENSGDPLTNNGIHLNDRGNSLVAKALAEEIAVARGLSASHLTEPEPAHLQEVALAASAKHYRVAEVVRPKNAVVYFGVRARPDEYADEMPRYHEMIRLTEEVVHQLTKDPKLSFTEVPEPSLAPMPEGKGRDDGNRTGIIKSVAENQAEFTVAEGFEVNLFASEEQFPELRNPVQIAFDARGRLWVVTMPSFPHTVPGLTPPDKILIFEDTDRDGKADKVTTFAEGLDALDGVAFHHEGVIISEQPRLWMMQDTDGDDQADTKRELLRGIDVTDSHHGGMVASDPFGAVIFSDGVFHRSQLETPFGVHRGMDATTYRLTPRDGRIVTEWQHTTPNPWNVDFDRWGNVFQMYGDGHVYDGSPLIWTPFGAYLPFRYGHVASYGKGSGIAVVSSPNFPDAYQHGIASASLLGRYAVTLTAFDRDEGLIKPADPLPILVSPNAAFRPADLEFGMDGALYVSDFCSPIIGHAQHPMRDPHWDHDFGRIWRVVHTKKPLNVEWPEIEGAGIRALCELLTHPQNLVRHHARIELRKHGADALKAVDEWIAGFDRTDTDYEQATLEAIFVCEGLGEVRPELIQQLLKSRSERYRGAAVRAIRIQADRLDNVTELLASVVNDPHPRVQVEVVDAVAHLRPMSPDVETILAGLATEDATVQKSLSYLDYGVEPAKGRSVPVLEVDPASQLTNWLWLGENGDSASREYQVGKDKLPGVGLFRTFIHSDQPQPAIIAINHKAVDIRLNDSLVFSQDSLWSGDQQVNVELSPGLNVIEILLKKGRRASKSMPPVYLYDPVGQALAGAHYASDLNSLRASAAQHEKLVAERGAVIHIQAAAGLQFAPTQLRATPGSKVRLVFENPDIMIHNWVLLNPGSVEEIGALADQLAAQPDGFQKGYLPDSDKILVASKLLSPKETQEIVFNAPEEPGEYPYICTFPGHWRIMQGVLIVAERKAPNTAPTTAKPKPKPKTAPELVSSDGVLIESANSPDAFQTLKPTATRDAKVTANKPTNNDPFAVLTDGQLAKRFGPIFGNGITDGAYKMDLGSVKPVRAVTSWSANQAGKRGAQRVRLYGSNSTKDPGWDLSDQAKFTALGDIETGPAKATFTAASLRGEDGKTLGSFRWIVWNVQPVTGLRENTAFQELSVETVK